MIWNSHLSTPILILFARQFWLLCRALRKSADQKLTWCISTCHPKSKYMCGVIDFSKNMIMSYRDSHVISSFGVDKQMRNAYDVWRRHFYESDIESTPSYDVVAVLCCRSVGSTVSSSQTFSTHLFWHWSTQEWRTRRCWRLNIN